MSKVFLPSFSRARRRRRVPEAVVEIKPPEWEGRKKEPCVLLTKYNDKNGKPLCQGEGSFFPTTGNEATCSKKCSEILLRIRGNRASANYVQKHPEKARASSAASIKKRRANSPELRAKEKEYVKNNRPLYNAAQQRYVDKNRAAVNKRKQDTRAAKRTIKCECACDCEVKFRLRQGPSSPLSVLCSKCRRNDKCLAANPNVGAADLRANRRWRKKQKRPTKG